jgi:hypothetical protein
MRRLFADAEGGAGRSGRADRGAVQRPRLRALSAGSSGRVTLSDMVGSAVRDRRAAERSNASMRRASGFCV